MAPLQTVVTLGVLVRLMVQSCPVTVAVAVALAVLLAGSSNVPLAVA